MSAFADHDLKSRQTATGLIFAVQQRLNQRPVSGSGEAASNVAYWVIRTVCHFSLRSGKD